MNYITEYWREIESGAVIVSERVRKQYKKLAERVQKTDGRYIFDEKRAVSYTHLTLPTTPYV